MHIAIVGPAHPYKGGGARHTTELAHRLQAAGHDVIIESWRAQYPARLYPGQQTVDEPEGPPFPRTHRRLAWYRPDGWLAAGRRLRTADLVIFVLITPIQVPAYLTILQALGKQRAKRTVVLVHNILPHERRAGDIALTRTLLRRAGSALVHSDAQAAQARTLAPALDVVVAPMPPHLPATPPAPQRAATSPSKCGNHPHRSGWLPQPSGPAAGGGGPAAGGGRAAGGSGGAGSAGGGVRLLFFGIVRRYKGLDVLLRALALAPEELTLTVAGEFWGGTAATEQLIAELGLSRRVTLRPGYVPASEIPELFAAADALVLPYREATASQNAQLAFSYGVPVITTTAGSLAEHVTDGVNGLTVAPGAVDDLIRALRLISEPGTLARLGKGVEPPDPEPAWAIYLASLCRPWRP
jgi:glycosyltransferase involved in cell wall biosynthesis